MHTAKLHHYQVMFPALILILIGAILFTKIKFFLFLNAIYRQSLLKESFKKRD